MNLQEKRAFWDYQDLVLFLGSILPIYLLAQIILLLGHAIWPALFEREAIRLLVFQGALYLLLLGSLFLVIRTRYGMPLWRSLGWNPAFRGAWWCVAGAPVLAFTISALGAVLRAPVLPTPAERLLAGDASLAVVGVFTTIIGPLFEELIFRGFMQPLLARTLTDLPAIAAASIPFALLHGSQYEWAWQHLVLIFLAGCVFGWVRYWANSTAASALLHMGYNLTLFVAYLVQQP